MFRCRVQQPDKYFVGMLTLASIQRNECSVVLQQFYPKQYGMFTYMGAGKTPLSVNDNVAGVSEYLFAFSGSRDGAANKQQFRVPQL